MSRLSRSSSQNDGWVLPGLAALKLLVHLPVLGRYGYHHDELYFLACGQHLAFGYVDHAPLVPWMARLADALLGESVYGLRLFAALAGAGAVLLTALLVRRLGGGRFAQVTAGLTMIIAPVYLRTGNMLCIPAFEPLIWVLCSYLLVRIIQEDNPRLWPCLGLVAGIGLMVKHSILFFGFGLLVALLLTPEREHFKTPWLYFGGGVAMLVFLPNILWQFANGWPTVEFLRELNRSTMGGIALPQFILGQVLYLNPINAPIWIAGLVFFFTAAGKPYRVLAWIYLVVLVLLVAVKSKIYYLAPAYPALLAGGSVAVERLVERKRWAWARPVTVGVLAAGGAILAPLSLPILSIDATERYVNVMTFGALGNVYELTGDLRGMFGWKERVEVVAGVYNGLSPEERERTLIFASWYGIAGAIDYFGKPYGLPGAVSGHMTYHLWGVPQKPIDTVVAAGSAPEDLREVFEEVTVAAEVELQNVNPGERRFVVTICRRPKLDLRDLWPRTRRWS